MGDQKHWKDGEAELNGGSILGKFHRVAVLSGIALLPASIDTVLLSRRKLIFIAEASMKSSTKMTPQR